MAVQQNGSLLLNLISQLMNPLNLSTPADALAIQKVLTYPTGTAAGQADLRWASGGRSIALSSSENLDLAGSLTDPFGNVITFADIRLVYIYAAPTNVNNVVLGNAASNGWQGWFGALTHTEAVRPGGISLHAAIDTTAWPVTAGTGDILKVANSGAGTAVVYDILVLGSSA